MSPKKASLDLDNPLFIAAVAIHEMFTAYKQAGFTPEEALQLCTSHILVATMQGKDDDGS